MAISSLSDVLEDTSVESSPKQGFFKSFIDYIGFLNEYGWFYSWTAPNRKGVETTFYKFRTMHPDAVKAQTTTSLKSNGKVEGQEAYNDFAAWTRRNNLDETPQAWNFLKGDIGVIGPRPLTEETMNKVYPEFKHGRLRRMFMPNLINIDYSYPGKTFEETKQNVYNWLIKMRACRINHKPTIGLKTEAFFRFLYNRYIKRIKSE